MRNSRRELRLPYNEAASGGAVRAALLIAFLGAATGCGHYGSSGYPKWKDVTSDKSYWGGYPPGSELITQQDLYILSITGGQPVLLEPGLKSTGMWLANYTEVESPQLSDYRASPAKWPYLIGILPKGSRIRIQKLEMHYTTETYDLEVHAVVLSGDFKGKDVEIRRISLAPGEGPALAPNSEFLKPVEDETKPATAHD